MILTFKQVASQQYVSMMLVVLAKETVEKHISEISITYAGIGLMGVMVNTSKYIVLTYMTY